jgi:hypothetical protein
MALRALTTTRSGLPARPLERAIEAAAATSRELTVAAAAALPALGRSLTVAAVVYAVERALSASLDGTLSRLLAPVERAGPAITRTELTEWVVIERIRRR